MIHTPIRAPQANAHAERFVRTVRAECLDWLLILGRRHLEHVLSTYAAHDNRERPSQGTRARAATTDQQRRPSSRCDHRTPRPPRRTHHEYRAAA